MLLKQTQRPHFSPSQAQALAGNLYGIKGDVQALPSERDQNFHIKLASGEEFVLRIASSTEKKEFLELQNQVMLQLSSADDPIRCPAVLSTKKKETIATVKDNAGDTCFVRLLTYLPGNPLANFKPHSPELLFKIGWFLGKMDRLLQKLHHRGVNRDFHWDLKNAGNIIPNHFHEIKDKKKQAMVQRYFEHFETKALPQLSNLRTSLIHHDANDYNLIIHYDENVKMQIGIIDFGDMVYSCTIFELAVAIAYLMLEKKNPLQAASHVVRGYHSVLPLTELEFELLLTLACSRLCMSVVISAHQQKLEPENDYLKISEKPAWELLHGLQQIDPNLNFQIPKDHFSQKYKNNKDLLKIRKRSIGKSLSISYQQPLHIVRGSKQFLYDEIGQPYLDCVNNVAHVGHCHPKVVEALYKQASVLNTNTRYLHENLVEYAERICSLMPEPLNVCFFVCSGSEANELALRMAKNYTNQNDIIVVDGAYHGNSGALVEISPYKFDGPAGHGQPPHVHKVMMPDTYRGIYKDADAGIKYASDVQHAIQEVEQKGRGVAAFICESLLGCAGQIVLPNKYLQEAFKHVRKAGAVCIADEVQVGFGRVGSYFWGFETQGVVPDIVTLGKPIGNGHPLAAVITTHEIADSFANGMEYFNTFGGNPVSCAVGMAVLNVIEEEKLQENALRVGAYLKTELEKLKAKYFLIGDVRGLGLFIGVELVLNRKTLEPAAKEATYIVERMKDHGILLSIDGPLHNVLKIKPPIIFTNENANFLITTFDKILQEDFAQK